MFRKTKTKSLSNYVIEINCSIISEYKILMKILILLSILYIIIFKEGVSQPINEKVI